MIEIFTSRWLLKEFEPLVRRARKAGIDPRNQDRFLQWIGDHRDDNVNFYVGTIRTFMGYAGDQYVGFVEDAYA